jgi:hypothetical protein
MLSARTKINYCLLGFKMKKTLGDDKYKNNSVTMKNSDEPHITSRSARPYE